MPHSAEPIPTTRQSRKLYVLAVVGLLLLVLGGWLFLHYGARSEFLMVMLANRPALMPSGAVAQNLDDETGSLVYSSLGVLANRRYAGAQPKARELLQSTDEYTWFNAALYLGKLRDPAAVPYLIKGLRHPAHIAHAEAVADLQAITGQTIGNDFAAWRQWYVTQHPDQQFDFEMRRSGR